MTAAAAPAKLNLALVVGPLRPDGKHEVASLMVPIELADGIELEPAGQLSVEGFAGDMLVRRSLEDLVRASDTDRSWRVTIEKRIPVAAGLGGGSSDAAAALRLANDDLAEPLSPDELHRLAATLGADVPFFLSPGPKLASGDGTTLEPVELSGDFDVLILMPEGTSKTATAAVYQEFDARGGDRGFAERMARLDEALRMMDLAALPMNDLASSPHAATLERLGALRADVTGAGPAVYGLFRSRAEADVAARELAPLGRVWLTKPAW